MNSVITTKEFPTLVCFISTLVRKSMDSYGIAILPYKFSQLFLQDRETQNWVDKEPATNNFVRRMGAG